MAEEAKTGFGLVRAGVDPCTGHGGFNPRPAVSGSFTVFCDGFPVVRAGDPWAIHYDGREAHAGVGIVGSFTVFCDGRPVMRSMDPLDCGSLAGIGSKTTFAG